MDSVLRVDQPVVAAARLGFAGIELTVERADLHEPEAGLLRGRAQAAEAAGLEVHALVLGDHNHGGVAAEDRGTARRATEEVRTAVGLAKSLGAGVVLVPFFLQAELRSDEDVERCTRAFTELCPYAAERGVSLCFEGLLDAGRIRELAARVSSPAFRNMIPSDRWPGPWSAPSPGSAAPPDGAGCRRSDAVPFAGKSSAARGFPCGPRPGAARRGADAPPRPLTLALAVAGALTAHAAAPVGAAQVGRAPPWPPADSTASSTNRSAPVTNSSAAPTGVARKYRDPARSQRVGRLG